MRTRGTSMLPPSSAKKGPHLTSDTIEDHIQEFFANGGEVETLPSQAEDPKTSRPAYPRTQ